MECVKVSRGRVRWLKVREVEIHLSQSDAEQVGRRIDFLQPGRETLEDPEMDVADRFEDKIDLGDRRGVGERHLGGSSPERVRRHGRQVKITLGNA